MNGDGLDRLRRILVTLSALATLWAFVLALTGGFVLQVGTILVLASRRPRNPAVIALLSAAAAWALSTADDRRRMRSETWTYSQSRILGPLARFADRSPWQVAPLLAASVAVAVVTLGMLKGALIAGGADAYGYVSEAHLWATGTLRVEQPFMRDMTWPFAAESLAPLGYRPAPHGMAIIPIYSPGLPLVMAVFERLGGRQAVFYVVPLLGGLAIWATYALGTRLAGRTVGVSAAVLLATSPPFLFQLLAPMTDVPVTAWWALSLALLLSERRGAALASGLAAGAAILTRPNLVPLAAILGTLLVWRAARERVVTGAATQRALLFTTAVIPACIAVGVINARLYGAPLASGYPLHDLYSWKNLWPNLARYPRWLLETETPVVFFALIPLFVARRGWHRDARQFDPRPIMIMLWCFIATVCLSYLFYMPYDDWYWLRFILPAFPPLCVLVTVGLTAILARQERGVRIVVVTAVIGLLGWHGVGFGLDRHIFHFKEDEWRTVITGEYIAQHLPDRAALICMQQSGSIRYYSGRLTVRYDFIPADRLDSVLQQLRRLGYHPYFVLEAWEEPYFRSRFRGYSELAALDWSPVARVDQPMRVMIYDPADRQAATPQNGSIKRPIVAVEVKRVRRNRYEL